MLNAILVYVIMLSDFVLFCNIKLIYAECQNAAHCGATTDARTALHFSMSHQFDLCCNLFRVPLC